MNSDKLIIGYTLFLLLLELLLTSGLVVAQVPEANEDLLREIDADISELIRLSHNASYGAKNSEEELSQIRENIDLISNQIDSVLKANIELKLVNLERRFGDLAKDLTSIEVKMQTFRDRYSNLESLISPANAEEILTVARMRSEILARKEFESGIDRKISQLEGRGQKTSEKIDSLMYWILGTLVTLLATLSGISIYLTKRLGRLMTSLSNDKPSLKSTLFEDSSS